MSEHKHIMEKTFDLRFREEFTSDEKFVYHLEQRYQCKVCKHYEWVAIPAINKPNRELVWKAEAVEI